MKFSEWLDEALVNIGDKGTSYPKFNQVIILAGGSASGKDFALTNFLGIEGKIFDVDKFKNLLNKIYISGKPSELLNKFEKFSGRYASDFFGDNFNKDPADITLLHSFFKEENIKDKEIQTFLKNVVLLERKPNIIFNITLNFKDRLKDLSELVMDAGYKKENIHIVWILNDINIAINQNSSRSRSVSLDILNRTHNQVSKTIQKIISNSDYLEKYMDGDFYIIFNKAKIDNKMIRKDNSSDSPFYFEFIGRFKIKDKNKSPMKLQEIEDDIFDKINQYVPNQAKWTR